MLEFTLPPPSDKILFEAVLEPTATAIKKLKKKKEMGEGEITTFLGKANRVAVGVPYCENLISRCAEKAIELPHKIKKLMDDYDFYFVSLSCSFLPDTDCRFVWARFGIALSAQSEFGEQENPIAHDMVPDEVLTEIKYRRKVSLSPGLKVSLGVLGTDTALNVRTEKEFTVYVPQIFAFGINTPNVVWDFKSTEERGIWGNKRDLLLVVRSPKNSNLKSKFLLGAEVEFKLMNIPLSKREDEIVDVEYSLSK